MAANWLDILLNNEPRIVAEVLERVGVRHLPGYETLPAPDLEKLVRDAVSARLEALASGETDPLDTFAAESGRESAAQGDHQLREVIGLALCVKHAINKTLIPLVADPRELLAALAKIDKINDRVVLEASEAFSQSREEAIRAEEASNLSLIEILKGEIAETDRRIGHLEEQIDATQVDLKEMQGFREALLSRLVSMGMAEEAPII